MEPRTETESLRKPGTLFVSLACIAGVIGLMALIIGISLLMEARDDSARHRLVSSLPDLRSAPAGGDGFLEGRISTDVQPLREGFVVFERERYGSNLTGGSSWNSLGVEAQPLILETSGGRAQVVNKDYHLDKSLAEWAHEVREESKPTATTGSVRISGFVPGGTVMITGHSLSGGNPGDFHADSIVGMDRKSFLDRLPKVNDRMRSFAIGLLVLSPLALAWAAWGVTRVIKTL
jgi:hypothetical protein